MAQSPGAAPAGSSAAPARRRGGGAAAGDLGLGGITGGREGTYYRPGRPGFQKFLLFTSSVAPLWGAQDPTLGESSFALTVAKQ